MGDRVSGGWGVILCATKAATAAALLISKLPWAYAKLLFKAAQKIWVIVKTRLNANFRCRPIRVHKQAHCIVVSYFVKVLLKGNAKALGKNSAHIPRSNIKCFGNIAKSYTCAKVLMYKKHTFLHADILPYIIFCCLVSLCIIR